MFGRFEHPRDPTLTALFHLARAWELLIELESSGEDITLGNKTVGLPTLERAWKEILLIRSRLPEELLTNEFMDRYGRFDATEIPDSVIERFDRDFGSEDYAQFGDKGSSKSPGVRTRRIRKRGS